MPPAKYVLRYFFDPGSGTCLWTANDEARDRFGYAVNVKDLPLTEETAARARELIEQCDACMDWDDPAAPSPASPDTVNAFNLAARQMLETIRRELGAEFEIVDQFEPVS